MRQNLAHLGSWDAMFKDVDSNKAVFVSHTANKAEQLWISFNIKYKGDGQLKQLFRRVSPSYD